MYGFSVVNAIAVRPETTGVRHKGSIAVGCLVLGMESLGIFAKQKVETCLRLSFGPESILYGGRQEKNKKGLSGSCMMMTG